MVGADQFSYPLGEGTLKKRDELILGLVLSNHTTRAASSGPHEAKEEKGGQVSVFTPGGSIFDSFLLQAELAWQPGL